MNRLVPPPTQVLDQPSVIRWAVGNPAGPRSQTWSVVGHANGDDVFIGLRDHIGHQKLSLHPSRWRMAYTESAALAMRLPEGVDRVVTRWQQTRELAPGWRRGAMIVVPTANLGPGYPEKPLKDRGTVTWWPAPVGGRVMRFDVLLGAPDRENLTILDIVGEVGRMTLSSGAQVWITADEVALTEQHAEWFTTLRHRASVEVPEAAEVRGWAWGYLHEDGAPYLIDLTNLARKERDDA